MNKYMYPHSLFCLGRASSHAVSIPLDMERQMKVLNRMLLSFISVLRALIGWKICRSKAGNTTEELELV